MTLFQLFKSSFTNQKELINAKKVSFPKTFLYILFLSILLTIPVIVDLSHVLQRIQADFETISTKIPTDTTFKDGKLTTETKDAGFIYQTDYLIFTFDPEGKTTSTNVQDDLIENVLGLAFLQDKLVFAVAPDSLMASALPSSPLEIGYDNLDANMINPEVLTGQAQSKRFLVTVSVLALLIALLPIAFSFALNLLMLSLIANIFNRFRGAGLTMGDTFKIMTFSSTVAVLVTILLQLFFPRMSSDFVLLMITIFTYYRILPPVKPKELK